MYNSTNKVHYSELRKELDIMTSCWRCGGRGWIDCPECDGTGRSWPEVLDDGVLKDLDPRCYECEGSGKVECPECGGKGEVEDD